MVTAAEYAHAPQTDAATAYGMRIAMFQAVKAWHALHPDEKTVAAATRLIQEASRNNPLLQSAGTAELVARYYGHVINRQADPRAVVNFLNSIPPSDVAKVDEALARLSRGESVDSSDLLAAAGAFSKGARTFLGINTLTEDFKAAIRDNPALTDKLTIESRPLDTPTARLIARADSTFRIADAIDNGLYHIGRKTGTLDTLQSFGVGFPAVAHLLGRASPAAEVLFKTVQDISAATQLDTQARVRELQQQLRDLALDVDASRAIEIRGTMRNPPNLTETQLRDFARDTEQLIRQYRAGQIDVGPLVDGIYQRLNSAAQGRRAGRQDITGGITLAGVTISDTALRPEDLRRLPPPTDRDKGAGMDNVG